MVNEYLHTSHVLCTTYQEVTDLVNRRIVKKKWNTFYVTEKSDASDDTFLKLSFFSEGNL